jgi:hypothetical protein
MTDIDQFKPCLVLQTQETGLRAVSLSWMEEHVPITDIMELIRSWEAASCATAQEFPKISWNPMVRYRVHKSPPLLPILSQIDQIHTTTFYLPKIRFNIINPLKSWSS